VKRTCAAGAIPMGAPIIPHFILEKRDLEVQKARRGTGMARVGLANHIGGKRTDRGDGCFVGGMGSK